MNLWLTSDFPASANEAVSNAMRGSSDPRIAWLAPSVASLRTHFATAQRAFAQIGFSKLEPIADVTHPADAAALLASCDVLYLSGGDPIAFRNRLLRPELRAPVERKIASGGCVVAASGGAMQLTPNISLFRLTAAPLDDVLARREEFTAIGAARSELLPHLNRCGADFLEAVSRYAEAAAAEVVALADGAAWSLSSEGERIFGDARLFPPGT
ncbi:MAG: Type 1 glutamine amidotransferase-like domain-containing protein [Deltaproteobacteria bacterium]|nr:Type 1 glutamine amidotransferase-like domain-containing protein [Deltaproteobacteria bacterium]